MYPIDTVDIVDHIDQADHMGPNAPFINVADNLYSVVQIQPKKHVLRRSCTTYAPILQRELDRTDHTDHTYHLP